MTAEPVESAPAEDSHPYPEQPPALPLRLAGHIGSTVASGNAAWLAAWRREYANGDPAIPPVIVPPGSLPVRHAVQAPPEPEPAAPQPPHRPRVHPSERLAALGDPAPTPAHGGERRPLFGRRRRGAQAPADDRPGGMAQEFTEPPENVPRPEEPALDAAEGPGCPPAAAPSGTVPPPIAEPEPAAADDAEQFGAPDEPFWPGSHGVVVPPETTEMTAVIERPSEEQQ